MNVGMSNMTDAVYRFAVIRVGCLECSFDGDSAPELVATHEGWEDALTSLRGLNLAHLSSEDAFIFDTLLGTMTTSKELADIERAQARESSGADE